MTYGECYKQFLITTDIDKDLIVDYKPAVPPHVTCPINNGVVVYLKDGNKLIYVADIDIKGYVYFDDEGREREVITAYKIINDEHIRFSTKSGEYVYFTDIQTLHYDNYPLKFKTHEFAKVTEHLDIGNGTSGVYVKPCDIEMITLTNEHKRFVRCTRTIF